jgi:hypothetical protein
MSLRGSLETRIYFPIPSYDGFVARIVMHLRVTANLAPTLTYSSLLYEGSFSSILTVLDPCTEQLYRDDVSHIWTSFARYMTAYTHTNDVSMC